MNNQEEEKVSVETEETSAENAETKTSASRRIARIKDKFGDKRFIVVAFSAFALLVLIIVFWFWQRQRSDAGRPVPAPRTVTFGESNSASPPTTGEQIITLAPEQAERAGIKTELVGEKLSGAEGGAAAQATGVVQANAYRETLVVSLVGGIARRVNAELGEQVMQGQTVAVVFSDEFAAAQSRYVALLTETENARRNYERTQKLVLINQPGRAELDQAAANLKTAEARLSEFQKRYERATKLVRIGASSREELEQDTTKLRAAEADAVAARSRLERARKLLDINPQTRSESEEAANKLRSAETELASVKQKLILYGMSPPRVNSLRVASQISAEIALPAPVTGTITSRSVNSGEVIEANKELLRVTDLSSVWVIAQVYENDLARIRPGSGASVTSGAYPNRVFRGQATYIDPNINQATRTAQVRVELENPGQILKIGMYVGVAFGALGTAENTMPTVPASAVQNFNNQQVVFLKSDQPNVFVMRVVRLAPESNGLYPVLEGVTVGEEIVTEGSFLLRAEWLKLHPNN